MSAPVLSVCAVAALALALPVVAASGGLEARARLEAASDAAALAASDAHGGWIEAEPCDLAAQVLARAGASLDACEIDESIGDVRVRASLPYLLGAIRVRVHAGPPFP